MPYSTNWPRCPQLDWEVIISVGFMALMNCTASAVNEFWTQSLPAIEDRLLVKYLLIF